MEVTAIMQSWERDFICSWAQSMASEFEREAGAERLAEIWQQWGTICAEKSGSVAVAEEIRNQVDGPDLDRLLQAMNERRLGGGNLHLEKNRIVGTYDHCYCPMVEQGMAQSPLHCECTRGWARAVFSRLLGRAVNVELETTILRGADCCRWAVVLD